jgi:predicted branched-subunit amino acid permease
MGCRSPRTCARAPSLIDESAAMAVGRESASQTRLGFWATGAAVFVCWNLATLLGALAGDLLEDPRTLGLDAAAPAAFLALLAPRLNTREPRAVAALAAAAALLVLPFVGPGVPVLVAVLLPVALLAALIATQTFAGGLDARAAGLAAATLAVAARAPFLVVVAAAAATALLRLL